MLATLFTITGDLAKKVTYVGAEKANRKAREFIKEAAIDVNKEKCITGLAAAGAAIVTEIIASTILKAMEVK